MKGSENFFSEKEKTDLCAENEGISLFQISVLQVQLNIFHCNFNFKMEKYTQVS